MSISVSFIKNSCSDHLTFEVSPKTNFIALLAYYPMNANNTAALHNMKYFLQQSGTGLIIVYLIESGFWTARLRRKLCDIIWIISSNILGLLDLLLWVTHCRILIIWKSKFHKRRWIWTNLKNVINYRSISGISKDLTVGGIVSIWHNLFVTRLYKRDLKLLKMMRN